MKVNVSVCLFLLGQSIFWYLGWLQNPHISDENALMENFQVAQLLLGLLPFLWMAARNPDVAWRILCSGLSLNFVTLIVLEVDLRKFDAPLINTIFNGRIRDAWLGSLWLVAGLIFLRHRTRVWHYFIQWLPSRAGCVMLLAGGLWILSSICDKLGMFPNSNHFYEELLEVNACFLMLVSALLTVQYRFRLQHEAGIESQGLTQQLH